MLFGMSLRGKDIGSWRGECHCGWYLCYIGLSLEIAVEMQNSRFKLKIKKRQQSPCFGQLRKARQVPV